MSKLETTHGEMFAEFVKKLNDHNRRKSKPTDCMKLLDDVLEMLDKPKNKNFIPISTLPKLVISTCSYSFDTLPTLESLQEERSNYHPGSVQKCLKIITKCIDMEKTLINDCVIDVLLVTLSLNTCKNLSTDIFLFEGTMPQVDLLRGLCEDVVLINGQLKEEYVHQLFNKICNKIKSHNWKNNLAGYSTYFYILHHISKINFKQRLPMLMPFALVLIDDFDSYYISKGINAVTQCLKAVAPSEFRLQGWGDVVYDAYFKKLYSNDYVVIKALLPSLLYTLKTVENDPKSIHFDRFNSRYNNVVEVLLVNLQMNTNIQIQRLYTKYLPDFISAMGIVVVLSFRELLNTFEILLQFVDLEISENILKSTETLLTVAWIRLKKHSRRLLKMLLRLAYDTENQRVPTEKKGKILKEITSCMQRIMLLSPELKEEISEALTTMKIPQFENFTSKFLVSSCG